MPEPRSTLATKYGGLKYSAGFASRSPQRALSKSATTSNLGPGAYTRDITDVGTMSEEEMAKSLRRSTSLSMFILPKSGKKVTRTERQTPALAQ